MSFMTRRLYRHDEFYFNKEMSVDHESIGGETIKKICVFFNRNSYFNGKSRLF